MDLSVLSLQMFCNSKIISSNRLKKKKKSGDIQSLDPATNLQEIQRMQEHDKLYHEYTISQTQTIGNYRSNSLGSLTGKKRMAWMGILMVKGDLKHI